MITVVSLYFEGSPVESFNAVVRLPSAAHKPVLNNKQSPQFKSLANKLCNAVSNGGLDALFSTTTHEINYK